MSYNITSAKVKQVDLTGKFIDILQALSAGEGITVTLSERHISTTTVKIELNEGDSGTIEGTLDNETGVLHITSLDLSSGCLSGFFECLEDAFRFTKGHLSAVLVWEGGDTIERLNVDDGFVKQTKIS